jgi:DNA-binding NarL/FixJ family response regulator
VLRCLMAGYSEQQAAKRLKLAFYMVHCHVRKIHQRLKVRSRTQLLSLCLLAQAKCPHCGRLLHGR